MKKYKDMLYCAMQNTTCSLAVIFVNYLGTGMTTTSIAHTFSKILHE